MDALVRGVVPHFSRNVCYQIQAKLAGTHIVAMLAFGRLKLTLLTVIIKQKTLIKGNRGSVLPDRCRAAGRDSNCKFPQRRKLVPLFRRISQDPLDPACSIIDTNDKILAA